jgi:hypothetical protein
MFPSTPRSSDSFLSLGFSDIYFVCISHLPCYMPRPSHHPNNIRWSVKLWSSSLCCLLQPPATTPYVQIFFPDTLMTYFIRHIVLKPVAILYSVIPRCFGISVFEATADTVFTSWNTHDFLFKTLNCVFPFFFLYSVVAPLIIHLHGVMLN